MRSVLETARDAYLPEDASRSHVLVGTPSLAKAARSGVKNKIVRKKRSVLQQAAEAYIREQTVEVPGNLGIPREEMPQIDGDQIPDFLKWLRKKGVNFTRGRARALDLVGTQEGVDDEKCQSMAQDEEVLQKPLLISSDSRVLDGHHRWGGALVKDPKMFLNTIRLDRPAREALDLLNEFSGTEHRKMGETV